MADMPKMIHRKPSGFSDPRYYEQPARIVGFVSGREIYAIFIRDDGRMEAAPIDEFIEDKQREPADG